MTRTQTKNLSFEQVEDLDVIEFTHAQNGATWTPPFMSNKDYIGRERVLRTSAIGQKDKSPEMQKRFPNGSKYLGIKYYVLKDLDLPATSKTSQIVASCETLNRVGLIASPQSEGKIQPALSVCIGGVYTIPEHRRKGYGGQMITRLNQFYDDISQQPDAPDLVRTVVITLYSEVGEYYSKFGYSSCHVPVHEVTELDKVVKDYCGGEPEADGGKNLDFEGCQSLVERQTREFSQRLISLQEKNPNASVFTVEPDSDNFKFFHHRALYHKSFVEPDAPVTFGYALPNGSHIVWHHNYWPGTRSLYLLKLHISEESSDKEGDFKKLLAHAVSEAKRAKLTVLQFWNSEVGYQPWLATFMEFLKIIEPSSNLYHENSSLSAIRISGVESENIIWDNNTKFCWF